jgi:hypothetical protein
MFVRDNSLFVFNKIQKRLKILCMFVIFSSKSVIGDPERADSSEVPDG